ncbi:hypothetical protein EWM64_g10556 [Hericium alpestre]|uniref:Uncharacterized protein n=1 Tax=Hericium alpestre TaxID=135208 RepID=A0A4Y9ZHG6_9AGAM|nr:hypothetical protein EWM64_g10556 [Hericium alpestre]
MEADEKNISDRNLNYHMKLHFIKSGQSPDLVQQLCSARPLENLRSLSIQNSPPAWSSQNWIDTFGRCTALENVLLDGRNAVHYCGELLQPGHAPLLSLRTLSLMGLNFHDDIIHGSGGVSVFHKAFLAWLTAWKEMGPLFKLIIKDCRVTKAYVTKLKQILEVEWKYE